MGCRARGRPGFEGTIVSQEPPDNARQLVCQDDQRVGMVVARLATFLVQTLELAVAAVKGCRGEEEREAQIG